MLLLWDGRLIDAIKICRKYNVRMDIIDEIINSGNSYLYGIIQFLDRTSDDRKLREMCETLIKERRFHEYITCRLYTNDLIDKNIDCINVLLKHKYYW